MNKDVIAAVLIAFGVSAVLCPVLIPFLKKLKFGQQVRDDGPQAHLKKAGTPTMGGLASVSYTHLNKAKRQKNRQKTTGEIYVPKRRTQAKNRR